MYVSTVQAKRYPFIAVQWHPEKALFEFSGDRRIHTLPAKHLSQALGNQFVWVRWCSCSCPKGRAMHTTCMWYMHNVPHACGADRVHSRRARRGLCRHVVPCLVLCVSDAWQLWMFE